MHARTMIVQAETAVTRSDNAIVPPLQVSPEV